MPVVPELGLMVRALAEMPMDNPLIEGMVTASVSTLTSGITQQTRHCQDERVRTKHHARLAAALHALADRISDEIPLDRRLS